MQVLNSPLKLICSLCVVQFQVFMSVFTGSYVFNTYIISPGDGLIEISEVEIVSNLSYFIFCFAPGCFAGQCQKPSTSSVQILFIRVDVAFMGYRSVALYTLSLITPYHPSLMLYLVLSVETFVNLEILL